MEKVSKEIKKKRDYYRIEKYQYQSMKKYQIIPEDYKRKIY